MKVILYFELTMFVVVGASGYFAVDWLHTSCESFFPCAFSSISHGEPAYIIRTTTVSMINMEISATGSPAWAINGKIVFCRI